MGLVFGVPCARTCSVWIRVIVVSGMSQLTSRILTEPFLSLSPMLDNFRLLPESPHIYHRHHHYHRVLFVLLQQRTSSSLLLKSLAISQLLAYFWRLASCLLGAFRSLIRPPGLTSVSLLRMEVDATDPVNAEEQKTAIEDIGLQEIQADEAHGIETQVDEKGVAGADQDKIEDLMTAVEEVVLKNLRADKLQSDLNELNESAVFTEECDKIKLEKTQAE